MAATLRIVITGATGMVGEGVLHSCLQDPDISSVLSLSRRSIGIKHPKLKEVLHEDFLNLGPVENQLQGYDACLFCLGVSSVAMDAVAYYRQTYELTMHVAQALLRQNPSMQFAYISGSGTDSSERGRLRWARVKGKTENDLRRLGFARSFAFRPGFILPTPGLKHAHRYYNYLNWMYPLGRALYPQGFCTLDELGKAMIQVLRSPDAPEVVEGTDIIRLAQAYDSEHSSL